MPESFAQTSEGLLLIANGIDPVLRFDGYSGQAEPAGLERPTTAVVASASGTGSITGSYTAYVSYLRSDGFESSLSPISGSFIAASAAQINYSSVPVSPDPRVTARRIYRNTNGQARTYYLDVTIDDNVTTTATSTTLDTILAARTAFPIFGLDINGNSLDRTLNHNPPPDTKPFVAFHLNTCYLAGAVTYHEGSCEVAIGSRTVQGRGTEWKENWAGRFFYVDGAEATGEIESVDAATQILTLVDPYEGPTNLFANYAIRPSPGVSSLLHYCDVEGGAEAWPPTNAIEIPEEDDEVTGLMVMYGYLYVVKRRSIYKFTTGRDPGADGFLYLNSRRGCINHRSWVVVDESAYMLDDRGVHIFSGTLESQNVSEPIQDLFRDSTDTPINWNVSRFFHASHSPGESTIRFFVAFRGDYLPRHALCFCYALQRWWIEEYYRPIGCSVLGQSALRQASWGSTGEQPYLGSDANAIFALTPAVPDVALTPASLNRPVLSAGVNTVTVAGTLTGSLIGAPVVHRSAERGVLQTRRITAVSGSQITVHPVWLYRPEAEDEIVIGGFPYQMRTHEYAYAGGQKTGERSVEVDFSRNPGSYLDVEINQDELGPLVSAATITAAANFGVESRKDRTTSRIDMAKKECFGRISFDGLREGATDGPRSCQIALTGIGGNKREAISQIVVKGVTT